MKKPSASKEVCPSWKKQPKGRYHTRIFDPLCSKLLPKKTTVTSVNVSSV